MSKKSAVKKQSSRSFITAKPFVISVSLLVTLLLLFVLRGWIRVRVIPATASFFHANSLKNTLDHQNADLQHPLNQLGLDPILGKAGCSLEIAKGISTEVDCTVSMHSYATLPRSKAGQINIEKQAKNLQNLLASKGWKSGSNGVTLTSLINGTYRGKDYSPDAYYERVIGSYDCVFDTMIAYSNPQPPAINSTLSCDRTINILGTPSGEFYTSSKGHY